MNIKRAILILVLLVIVGARHLLLSGNKEQTAFQSLAPTHSELSNIHIEIDTLMKHLVVAEMKAGPDQDYLISMILDKLEMIQLICFYHLEMFETLLDGRITGTYQPEYMEKLSNNMNFEIVRIELHMEKITSIYPLISDKAASDTIKKSQKIGQRLIKLFKDTEEQLSDMLSGSPND